MPAKRKPPAKPAPRKPARPRAPAQKSPKVSSTRARQSPKESAKPAKPKGRENNRLHGVAAPRVIEPVNFEGADLRPEDRVAIVGDECIFEWIEEGFSPREIGKMLGVSRSWLRNWLADDETRSARAREARRHSAHYWADKAERVLAEVGDNVPINRRRELSQLYRWRARVADPEFIETEKREHTHTIDGLTELVKYVQQAAAARIKPSHPGLIASSQPTQPSQDALVRLQGERLENPKRTD